MGMSAKERTKRCEYLFNKASSEINPEQREAYVDRLQKNWNALLNNFEMEIENLAADLGVSGCSALSSDDGSSTGTGMGRHDPMKGDK